MKHRDKTGAAKRLLRQYLNKPCCVGQTVRCCHRFDYPFGFFDGGTERRLSRAGPARRDLGDTFVVKSVRVVESVEIDAPRHSRDGSGDEESLAEREVGSTTPNRWNCMKTRSADHIPPDS